MIDQIKVRLFICLFSLASLACFGAPESQLVQADSLFAKQQYTQAFAIYESLYNDGQASAAMLLKMAFIQDASGNFSDALYYLDQYYLKSADRDVITKIEELAKDNELNGYRYNDADYLLALISKYKVHLTLLLLSLILMLTAYSYATSKKGEKAFATFFLQLFLVIILFGLSNYTPSREAIIVSDQALLRSGPSAGAEPIEMISKGHKVKVMDRQEVWTKISWNGEDVFVRNDRLRVI